MEGKDRIICALDVDNAYSAIQLVTQLKEHVGIFKVGLELLTSAGVQILEKLSDSGAEKIFFDAKLHDIPNTVAGAMRGVARLGVWCVTVHTTGGSAMLRAAVEAGHDTAAHSGVTPPLVLGVTALTSLNEETLHDELRVSLSSAEYVAHLAGLAERAGCSGVIASPQEIEVVRRVVPREDFLVITPGVRPLGSERGDQARVMTPGDAIRHGASYLVIGRPIVAAKDPIVSAQAIALEIEEALAARV